MGPHGTARPARDGTTRADLGSLAQVSDTPEEPVEGEPGPEEGSGGDDAESPLRGWIDPDDRLWRHPSEVRPAARGRPRSLLSRRPGTPPPHGAHGARRCGPPWSAIVAFVVRAALALLGPPLDRGHGRHRRGRPGVHLARTAERGARRRPGRRSLHGRAAGHDLPRHRGADRHRRGRGRSRRHHGRCARRARAPLARRPRRHARERQPRSARTGTRTWPWSRCPRTCPSPPSPTAPG